MGEVVVGISGASGAVYGKRLTEVLHEMGFTQNLVTDDQGRRRLAEGSCDAPKTWCADGLFALLP